MKHALDKSELINDNAIISLLASAQKLLNNPLAQNKSILMNRSAIILALRPSIGARNTFLTPVALNISILMNSSAIILAL